MQDKDIVVFIDGGNKQSIESVKKYGAVNKQDIKILEIRNSKTKLKKDLGTADFLIMDDLSDPYEFDKKLEPYKDRLLAVTCRGEASIQFFSKIIPHVPYVKTPTAKSLLWATDKIAMRKKFNTYDKKITPKFLVVSEYNQKTINEIEKKVGFPLVIKPSGLAASLLVTICYTHEELEEAAKKVFKKIKSIYKENKRETEPKVLVEQFMEGEMYSIDGYVNSRGRVYFCPLVRIKTGRDIGLDDFFAYSTITPTTLKKPSIEKAEAAATKAIHALGLRSVSAHVEMMRTDAGWKIIELGPRIGGFRHKMYELSYGINHALNDILIRIPKKPFINKKVLGHSATLKFFARNEGVLSNMSGIKSIQKLASFSGIKINKKLGDKCLFSRHGGKSVFELTLFNKNRSDLLADIRRTEKSVVIKTSKNGKIA